MGNIFKYGSKTRIRNSDMDFWNMVNLNKTYHKENAR